MSRSSPPPNKQQQNSSVVAASCPMACLPLLWHCSLPTTVKKTARRVVCHENKLPAAATRFCDTFVLDWRATRFCDTFVFCASIIKSPQIASTYLYPWCLLLYTVLYRVALLPASRNRPHSRQFESLCKLSRKLPSAVKRDTHHAPHACTFISG